jgi:RNA polymerase sigma-70 factor (ECF subfamily)
MDKKLLVTKVFEKEFEKLFKYFYTRLLNKEAAEDLASDTFLHFVKAVKDDSQIDDPTKYLYGIAHHKLNDYLRQKYKLTLVPLEEWHLPINETASDLEAIVKQFIELLPEQQRIILQLRLLEKRTLEEICQILNKNNDYVRTTQQRGINKLRELLAVRIQT